MKKFLLSLSILFISCKFGFAQTEFKLLYVSPKPNSIMVSNKTNIIMRYSDLINKSTLSNNFIKIEGSKSGIHNGELVLSDDEKTMVFNPSEPFAGDEKVTVRLLKGVKTQAGIDVPGYSFSFETAPGGIEQLSYSEFSGNKFIDNTQSPDLNIKYANKSTLPAPEITINSINNPAPGYIFMATWDRNVPAKYGNFIFILDKNGAIVDSVRVKGAPFNFQIQDNGLLTYALGDFSSNIPLPGEDLRYLVLDSNLAVVDSFKMKNGYTTDFHEFKMLPNGHVILMSYHTILYDMSKIVEGGKTDASLVINIIQEQDRNRNVVFEWRNIDYVPITDSDLDLTGSRINYGTINAFDVDTDGNLLVSFRNMSEIMKISRTTGEIIWRMGSPRSQFTYVGEHEENAPYYHARQHNIRRRPNGNVTLFDNGEFHNPPYSRAVEYSLDEVNKVATLVKEWRYPNGNIFAVLAGNAEPLPNGGWFIDYGVPNPQFVKRNAVEVAPDGSIALELTLPDGVIAYRAYKFPWKEYVNKPSFTNYEVTQGNTYSFNNDSIYTGVKIKYISLNAADYNEAKITRIPYGPVQPQFVDNIITVYPVSIIYEGLAINSQTSEVHVNLNQYPEIKDPGNTVLYYREFPNQGLFVPKSTTYDDVNNELIAVLNGFGEIVFGAPDDSVDNNTPILYEPLNRQKLILQDTIKIKWTGKGFYNSFNVQVSTDSTFATILHETNTNRSEFPIAGLTNNTKYFWRVNSELNAKTSEWSDVWSFIITDPFIGNVLPQGGEKWSVGSRNIIRWETNILDSVRIDLLQGQNNIATIDTIPGSIQAYAWNLPLDLNLGDNYKIKVTSQSDSTIFGISENEFSVIDTVTGIDTHNNSLPDIFQLHQNYPNPFNPATVIKYSIPTLQNFSSGKRENTRGIFVQLNVYDVLGRKVASLVNELQQPGNYQVTFNANNLTSGIYIYQLRAGEFVQSRKLVLLK